MALSPLAPIGQRQVHLDFHTSEHLENIACAFCKEDFQAALKAAEKALAIDDKDLHVNTTLSRIWVQIGDQKKAEYYNARARMLGWKEQLKDQPESL